MERGFYTIMAAQFFSSLADNALLVVAIALLIDLHAPAYLTPMLKFVFVLFYVIFAPFVGAFADSMPKGRVMFISNTIKITGCGLLFPELLVTGAGVGSLSFLSQPENKKVKNKEAAKNTLNFIKGL